MAEMDELQICVFFIYACAMGFVVLERSDPVYHGPLLPVLQPLSKCGREDVTELNRNENKFKLKHLTPSNIRF